MNKNHSFVIWVFLLIAAVTVTACTAQTEAAPMEDMQHTEIQPRPRGENSDDEHGMDHAHVEAPDDFAALTNPFGDDHKAIESGEELFQTNCATCHGPEGRGDGPGAEALDPKPATLADGMMMNSLSDGYLFWRVSKGGAMEPFNSAMPAWETGLTEAQRWQVISFVRTLADDDGHMDDDHAAEHMDDMHSDDEHIDDMHGVDEHLDDEHTEEGEHTENESEHSD